MRFSLMVIAFLAAQQVQAEERFYPSVGADGRLEVIRSPASSAQEQAKPASAAKVPGAAVEAAGAPTPKTESEPTVKPPVTVQDPANGESYLTSERLETEGYKPEGKNRFYYLPDGSMGHSTIESDAGVPILVTPLDSGSEIVRAVRPSPNYAVLAAEALAALLPEAKVCMGKRELRRAKDAASLKRLSLEPPLSSGESRPDVILDLRNIKPESALRLVSYATSMTLPGFYVPLPVWLDEKGCRLSGAWNYWVEEFPGSEFRFSSLETVLVMPTGARWVAFYYPPLVKDLPFRLQKQGSLSLEIFEN